MRELIEAMPDGLKKRVAIDLYRELKDSNLFPPQARAARAEMDELYPDQETFRALRSSARSRRAGGTRLETVDLNVARDDLTPAIRRALQSVRAEMIDARVLDRPIQASTSTRRSPKRRRSERGPSRPLADAVRGKAARTIEDRPAHPTPSEGYEYWVAARRVRAEQKENELVTEFLAYLQRLGYKAVTRAIATEAGSIECDIYDVSRHILYEAKADASDRPQLRMAIGQLFDYAHFGFSKSERARLRLALLLPRRPTAQIERLLSSIEIGLAWPDGRGGFLETFPERDQARRS